MGGIGDDCTDALREFRDLFTPVVCCVLMFDIPIVLYYFNARLMCIFSDQMGKHRNKHESNKVHAPPDLGQKF